MTRAPRSLLVVLALSAVVANDGCARGEPTAAGPFTVADSLRDEGRFAEALPHYRTLRDSLAGSADDVARWRAETGWGEMLLRTGRLDSASAALHTALTLAGGDQAREARTRHVRSLLLHRQGRLDSALVETQRALAGARAAGDRELEVDAMSVHGTVHSLSGRYRLAAVHAESALAGERTLDRPPQFLATRLNNLGVEYRHLGRLTDAEGVLLEGLTRAESLSSPRVAMLLNGNMSNLRRMTGRFDESLRYTEDLLRVADELGDVQGRIVGHDDLGVTHMMTGNLIDARAAFERSLALNTPTRSVYGRIVAELGIGRVEIAEGRPQEAERALRAAMQLADSGGFGLQRVAARTRLAEAALVGGQAARALTWADAAVQLSDSVGDLESQLHAMEARAAALERLGRVAPASDGFLAAIALLESSRGRIALGDLRMSVAEPYWSVYEGAIRTLLARGDASAALAVAERAKARMLLELMADRDAKSLLQRAGASPVRALKERLRVLVEERSGARSGMLRVELDREIAAVVDSLAAVERIEGARDVAGAARFPRSTSVSAMTAGLLTAERALVMYFWGARDVYAWRVAGSDVRAARIGSVDSVGAMVEFLRATLEAPTTLDWILPARRAWTMLLRPLVIPDVQELLVVPDGALAHLPFEMLVAEGDSLPVGVRQRVVYGPSASVLLAISGARAESPWSRTLLAVGNPDATSLPHAESEARAVFALYRAAGADLLVGRRATRARWLALDPSRYRFLHIAAHAEVNDRHPSRTRVLLSEGALDLATIRDMDLRADLVTLSACETALGLRVRGEGVIGLPHAFLAAGAGAVLVTLWRVDDRATAAFMEDFYEEVHAGARPAAALQSVRRRWFERRPRAHPAFWAPFVLVGG